MVRLRESDFRTGLELLGAMQEASRDVASFAHTGVESRTAAAMRAG